MDLPLSAPVNHITAGPIAPGLLRFGLPLVAAMLLHGAFNLVDAFYIGRLEDAREPLAAIGICDPLLMIAVIFANGIATASVALITRAKGAGRLKDMRHAAGQSLLLVGAISLIFGLAGAVFARQIGEAMGARGVVLELTTDYLRLMFAGSCTMIYLLQFTSVLRGAGDSHGPTIVLIGANLLNVAVDPFLIFGWAGLPAMGLMGAAWATVGSRALGCLLAIWLCMRRREAILPRGAEWKPDWPLLRKLLSLGWPNTIQLVARVAAVLALVALINRAFTANGDQSATAAFGLGVRLDMMAMFTAMGWGAAASTYVGQNVGARRGRRARKAAWICAGYAVATLGVGTVVAQIWTEPLVRLFAGGEEDVVAIGVEYLRIVSLSYPAAAMGVVLALSLNGAGSTRAPAVIDGLVYCLLVVPVAYLAVHAYDAERWLIWALIAAGNAFLAMVYAIWFRTGTWRKIAL